LSDARDSRVGTPSFTIVLETANLADGDFEQLDACLASLAAQELPPRAAERVLLIDAGDVPTAHLERARTRYPWLDLIRVPTGTAYYDQKMHGASLAETDVIVFCDSDCVYERSWLGSLLAPFARDDVDVVTGATTTPVRGPYGLAMALVYLFPPWPPAGALVPTDRYVANNVAFRRPLLARHPIPRHLPIYRGNCALHSGLLGREGVVVWRQPDARCLHSGPAGMAAFANRFLMRGYDFWVTRGLTREPGGGLGRPRQHSQQSQQSLLRRSGNELARLGRRVPAVFSGRPARVLLLPAALPIASAALLLSAVGFGLGAVAPGLLSSRVPRAPVPGDTSGTAAELGGVERRPGARA
jgi:hypothetical protein